MQAVHRFRGGAGKQLSLSGELADAFKDRKVLSRDLDRALHHDFERYARTVAAFIRLAMIRIMLRRLTRSA
jgi:hypothetical protein